MAKIREFNWRATSTFKKGVRIPRICLASAFALCAIGFATAGDVVWRPQNGSTDISAPANWGGTLPGNGAAKRFDSSWTSGDYTVSVPVGYTAANPYVSAAGFTVEGLAEGQKVTFDATGTAYRQLATFGQTWSDSKLLRFVTGGAHMFNIEGLNAANQNDNAGFSLVDGKISFLQDSANGSRLIFESGSFDNSILDPASDSTSQGHNTILGWSLAPANSKVVLAGGNATLHNVIVRGQSSGFELLVTGGNHLLTGSVNVNHGKNNDNYNDGVVHVEGGKLAVASGVTMWLGHHPNGKGILKIDGDGVFEHNGSQVYWPDGPTYVGELHVGGNGVYRSSTANHMIGHQRGTANIYVYDNGLLDVSSTFNMCDHAGTTALTLSDHGVAILPYLYAANAAPDSGSGQKAHASISIEDNAVLKANLNTQSDVESTFDFSMSGNSRYVPLDSGLSVNFGDNKPNRTFNINLAGGAIDDGEGGAVGAVRFRPGKDSSITFSGTHLLTKYLSVEGAPNSGTFDATQYTNTVRVTGGVLDFIPGPGGTGIDIIGVNRNSMFLLEGGEVTVDTCGQAIRIGVGGSSSGWHAIYRQTGGVSTYRAAINMCDNHTDAEFELDGGVCYIQQLRGWNGCVYRGGQANAICRFNGGTLRPISNNLNLMYTIPEVYLGEDGLTLDTYTHSTETISVAFQNLGVGTEEERDGLFVKKGDGILVARMKDVDSGTHGNYVGRSLKSTHTYTRVDEGTLQFSDFPDGDKDVQFGKNISVSGGATLSLAGAGETLTVDTLTLGDGHGFAVLKLDEGDTVVVEAANGITANCGAIDVPWKSTEGPHAVFTCKQGVLASELDKIAVHNADATKDYAWTTDVDSVTGYTICSVIVASKGTLTKTITYSSGAVVTNGTGKVSGIIANESGTQNGELVLASTASVSVDADTTMTLNGPLVGTGAELVKTGSGKLVVGGSNPGFYGSFASGGGTFEVLSATAFGPNPIYFPLVLSGGTLRYSGQDEVVFMAGLRIAATESKKQVILDNDGDMTFNSTEYVRGGFVKTGVGTLKFDLPAGVFSLGSNDASEDIGANAGQANLPANGDSPTSNSGLYGVTILEGTLKVVGEGVSKTTLQTLNRALLGGGYPAQAAAKLIVENATINWGSGSRSGSFCHDLPADIPSPEICLTNALLWSDSPALGVYNGVGRAVIKLSMKDSEYYGHYNSRVGAQTVGVEIDADNSKMHSNAMIGWSVQAKTLQADFHGENAELASYDNSFTGNGSSGRFYFYNWVTGELRLRDGAALRTTRGVLMNSATPDVVFDNGRFQIDHHTIETCCTSTWEVVSGTGFTTQGGGMVIDICEGSRHGFNFPIKGTGKVVKTGAGTFELVAPRAEGEKLLQYTGGTTVSNGTLVVDGALVADGAKSFSAAEGGALDLNGTTLSGATLSGAGVVTNGTLSTATITYDETEVPTFSDVVFSDKATVDFGHTDANPIDKAAAREGLVVAHYTGAVPAGLAIKVKGTGIPMALARTRYENGDVIVTITRSGFSVTIR